MDELIGKIAVLRETNLFKEVTLDVLQEMAYRIQRKKMKQGEVIFNEGDVPLGFYIVSSGEVILKKGGNLLATLKESEFFGESGLLSNNPRLATAIAGKNCTLLYLNNEIFNNLIRNYPEILSIFMQKVIRDLEQTDEPTRFIKSHNFYETAVAQASKILPRISEDKSPEFKEKFHALREMDLFKGLTDEALTPIVEMTQWKTAKKGEVIFSKEDVPDYMYIIFKGSVIVKKGKEELSLLNGHDFFGEAGVVSNQPRMASVIAVEDSVFLRISKESFKTIIAAYPSIARSILFKIVSYHYPKQHQHTLFQMEELLPQPDYTLDPELFFESLGLSKSKAITVLDLHLVIKKDHIYYIDEKGLTENKAPDKDFPLKELKIDSISDKPPKHVEIEGIWNDTVVDDDGKFVIKADHLEIPVVEASKDSLAYYGAKLLDTEEKFKFPEENFPIWNVLIGEDYLKNYIMTEKGGGVNFECQMDKPHFHMPANKEAHGYYVLGRKVSSLGDNKAKALYRFTAFKIPFGKAVYTFPGVIHCDAGLQGHWMVGCSNAKQFSSVVMRTQEDKIVNMHFSLTTPIIQNNIVISIYGRD